ncbi:hypothetical protein AC1031_016350 [Aphanomyces cochlioides]|nr:hypothetical protein AC1031_016350 [Aphanomyces cochlioides]
MPLRLALWSPILAPFFTVVTLITCFAIAKAKDIYVGSLSWPYFSDMGRDDPAYYVFVVGLCLTAIFLLLTWWFNWQFQASVLSHSAAKQTAPPSLSRCNTAASIMGMLSTIGLPILSIYRVSYPHPEVHNYAAYFFFVFQAAAVLLNTYVSRRILTIISENTSQVPTRLLVSIQRAWRVQIAFASIFLVAFILYIPVGLALVCEFARLTQAKCIDLNMGVEYCTVTVRLDATNTKLYDYSNCYSINQMRAGAQLACILTLVGYAVSFVFHELHHDKDDAAYEHTTG